MRKISPLNAIHAKCSDCSGDSCSDLRNCFDVKCPLYDYRSGKKTVPTLPPSLRAIRKFCLDCQGGSAKGVKECTDCSCPLFQFRFGKNPNIKISDEQREILIQRLAKTPSHTQCRKTTQS